MKIRIAQVINDSIVDGPGYRLTVFCQGCPHGCQGCHNPQTHDFSAGHDTDTDAILKTAADNILLSGITLSGGEPFCQVEACAELAKGAHKLGLSVITYTGFWFETLLKDPQMRPLLEQTDYLIDGPFVLEQRSLECRWRGSTNQRILDMKQSLAQEQAVIAEL